MTQDLATIGQPIADALVPGWRVEWLWCTQAELDAVIPGAMAICSTTPTRSMALVRVLSPWPADESLGETLWHELSHAALSPLTSLIPASDGATMVEEQIVERFGVLLSKLTPGLARVVAKAIRTFAAPRVAARISALAKPRARTVGGKMNAELMKKALELIAAGDAAGALTLLTEIVAAAAGGGAPMPAGPESAPEGAPMGAAPAAGAVDPAKKDDAPMARQHARAKSAADSLVKTSIRARIHEVRVVEGLSLSPATEQRILLADSIDAAETIISTVRETIEANGGAQARARSGAKPKASGGAGGVDLTGFSSRDLAALKTLASNPKAAEQYAGRVRARLAKGGAS